MIFSRILQIPNRLQCALVISEEGFRTKGETSKIKKFASVERFNVRPDERELVFYFQNMICRQIAAKHDDAIRFALRRHNDLAIFKRAIIANGKEF